MRVERALRRLVERAAGEARARGADRGAEHVERRHRLREAAAALAEQGVGGKRMSVNLSVASGCGAITWIRSLSSRPVRAGIDDEGGDALRARRFAGAGEEDVEIGDAAVGDIGLGAVDGVAVAVFGGARFPSMATSEPEVGSVSAKAAIFSPLATAGR